MAVQTKTTETSILPNEKTLLDKVEPWVSPIAAIIIVAIMAYIGPDLNRSQIKVTLFAFMWIGLASSWNLIGGYTGYTDFGHAVFVGIGGYVAGVLMAWLGIIQGIEPSEIAARQEVAFSFPEVLPIAFIIGAIFAALIGYPTLRLKGPYFAIAMLGVFVAMREVIRNNPFGWTNGGKGISFLRPFADSLDLYYYFLGLAAVIFFVSLWMYRVQVGKMLKAVRDDEVGADMRGINTTFIKIGIFMLAGGFTAMIGAAKAYNDAYIDPDTIFPDTYTIEIIMMTMLGGLGRPWGPVIGAIMFYYGKTYIWANAGGMHLTITGFFLALVVIFMPGGVLSLLDPEDRGLAWFIRTRILRKREKIFDDSDEFTFKSIPVEQDTVTSTATATDVNYDRVVLEGKGIVKNFGGLTAVNQVDFKIYEGEIVGLLGPNGSGKTTLFNCVSGTLAPTKGRVFVDKQEVTGLPPWKINRSGLSRTFQRLRVYGKQTVYDNMLLARKWLGVPPWLWFLIAPKTTRDKADELIDFLNINHVRNVLAHNLSGGQQRLLEIGMTLMSDPIIVLLDEATSGVNPALVEEIKDKIRQLNQERGVTFFLVEHNMNFAMELCERLYVLDYGSLIAEGSPEEIQNDDKVIEAYFGRDE